MSDLVLVIEDDASIAAWVKTYLERAAFRAEIAHDGPTGLERARALSPDLIVLDLMLPGIDGMRLCDTLREESDVPIIMLTAKARPSDRVRGLERGADDYVVKPFDPEELVARAKAVLRRVRDEVMPHRSCGRLTLDEASREVRLDGESLDLTEAQFRILAVLMRHPNHVLSRERLIELAFGDGFGGYDRAIDSHIRRLRQRLHRDGFGPIQTVYGAGYRMVC